MAYNEALTGRVRAKLARKKGLREIRMFGGLCFMLRGHMCCGVSKDDLVVRVGPDRYEDALESKHARPMDFTGRALKGFVYVGPGGYRTDESLSRWIDLAVEFVSSLPPKKR
jgi:hypothetical protein